MAINNNDPLVNFVSGICGAHVFDGDVSRATKEIDLIVTCLKSANKTFPEIKNKFNKITKGCMKFQDHLNLKYDELAQEASDTGVQSFFQKWSFSKADQDLGVEMCIQPMLHISEIKQVKMKNSLNKINKSEERLPASYKKK